MLGILGSLVTGVAANFISGVAHDAYKKKKEETGSNLKVENIKPKQIMGDRGDVENGFRPDLFYKPLVGNAVAEAVNNNKINLIVITGRFASGKSRAVYEFLKNNQECKYRSVYIVVPTGDKKLCVESALNQIKSLNPDDTIIIIDDINNLFDEGTTDLGMGDFLSTLTNRSFKVLITISKGEKSYQRFIDNCQPGCDTYRGQKSNSVIEVIEIPKIERGDPCFVWCRTNFPSGLFSTVIGGYIPNLQRSIEKNLYSISKYESALNLLISYHVGVKFRHHEGAKAQHIRQMYTLRFGEISDEDFTDAIGALKTLGFIEEDYDYEGEGTAYKVGDTMIYNSFVSQCGRGLMGVQAYNLMANTRDTEISQCEWLLQTDPGSPILYSRILYHSRLKETKDFVKEQLDRILNDEEHRSQEFLQPYLKDPIPALIELYGEIEYPKIRQLIEQGIVPTIDIICALLRIAPRSLIQDEITSYANGLVNQYNLPKTIYYYRCIEQLDPGYDMSRIAAVQTIYNSDPDGEYVRSNYQRYCTDLLCKAMDPNKSIDFWEHIAPTGLMLNEKSIYAYREAVRKKTKNRLSEILLENCFVKSQNVDLGVDRCKLASILLETAPTFEIGYRLYQKMTGSLVDEDIQDSATTMDGVRCMLLFPLLDKLSYKREEEVGKARELVASLLTDGERDSVWFSSRGKILNKYLGQMGSYDSFVKELAFLTDSNLKDFVNDDTIATAVNVVNKTLDDNFGYKGTLEDIKGIIELKKEYGHVTDPSYNTSLY